MTQEHPITPPPELVQQWVDNLAPEGMLSFATQAAHWGADQELEACRLWVSENCSIYDAADLSKHRRPKPPTLKEQALQALEAADFADYPVIGTILTTDQHALIRTALESLPS